MITSISDAYSYVNKLAGGVNPVTNEFLPDDHICLHPDVQKALRWVLFETIRRNPKSGSTDNQELPENANQPWSQSEKDELLKLWNEGWTLDDLAKHFNRTEGGISSRLSKLGAANSRAQIRVLNEQRLAEKGE